IFCRNLLIYFDRPSRRRAVEILDRLLADDGLLFVGHAERLPMVESRFTPRAAPGCFCYAKGRAPAAGRLLAAPPNGDGPANAPALPAGPRRVDGDSRGKAGGNRRALTPHPGPLPGGERGPESLPLTPAGRGPG